MYNKRVSKIVSIENQYSIFLTILEDIAIYPNVHNGFVLFSANRVKYAG